LGTVTNATWQTAQQKFYGGAADFSGFTTSKLVTIPTRDAFLVGTGDFTFSWWSWFDQVNYPGKNLTMFGAGNNTENWRLSIVKLGNSLSADGNIACNIQGNFYSLIPPTAQTASVWQHYAYVRRSGVLYAYVNGVQAGSQPSVENINVPMGVDPFIGGYPGIGTSNWGYLQDIVVAKKALWTGNFTPPGQLYDTTTGHINSWADVPELALALPLNTYAFSPKGTVGSVNTTAKTMLLATSTGTWGPANTGKYVIGPTKSTPAANVKLYCKLDAAGAVSDLQSADPGFTAWTPAGTGPYTGAVKFPATLPSGAAPDTDLPAGTTITVEVQATNTSGSDSAKSNTVAPA
jgi:hypothetical protein